jgi:katanin p60 ATPase-containing subunit A1
MPMRRKILSGNVNIIEIASMQNEIDIPLTMVDFEEAIKNISASVSNTHLKEYEDWMKEFGSI